MTPQNPPQGKGVKNDLVTSTSTFRVRSRRELEQRIVESACELARRKWYQPRKFLVEDIINNALYLNDL